LQARCIFYDLLCEWRAISTLALTHPYAIDSLERASRGHVRGQIIEDLAFGDRETATDGGLSRGELIEEHRRLVDPPEDFLEEKLSGEKNFLEERTDPATPTGEYRSKGSGQEFAAQLGDLCAIDVPAVTDDPEVFP
jgi:hypothetical protein